MSGSLVQLAHSRHTIPDWARRFRHRGDIRTAGVYRADNPDAEVRIRNRWRFLEVAEDRPRARVKVIDGFRAGPWNVYQNLRPWEHIPSQTPYPETAFFPHFLNFDLRSCPRLYEEIRVWASECNLSRDGAGDWVFRVAFETLGLWQVYEARGTGGPASLHLARFYSGPAGERFFPNDDVRHASGKYCPEHFEWLVRYQIEMESIDSISSDPRKVTLSAAKKAIRELRQLIDLPPRRPPGRPSKKK